MIDPDTVTLQTINTAYNRIDRLRESSNAAARCCAQSMLEDDPVTALRFAKRYRSHLASAEALRTEVLAAAAQKFGVLS